MNSTYRLMVDISKEIDSEIMTLKGMANSITGRHSVHAYKKIHSELNRIALKAHETLYDDYLTDDEDFQTAYSDLVELKEKLTVLGCKIAKYA